MPNEKLCRGRYVTENLFLLKHTQSFNRLQCWELKSSVLGTEQLNSGLQKICSRYLKWKRDSIKSIGMQSCSPCKDDYRFFWKSIWDFCGFFFFALLFLNKQSVRSFASHCIWIFYIHPNLYYRFWFSAACTVVSFIRDYQFNFQQQHALQVDPSERPHAEYGSSQCE